MDPEQPRCRHVAPLDETKRAKRSREEQEKEREDKSERKAEATSSLHMVSKQLLMFMALLSREVEDGAALNGHGKQG